MRDFARALTRSWATLYTAGLPGDLRAPRRDEIESDLWEQAQDGGTPVVTAIHMLLRLATGIPSDLVWRVETGAALRLGKDPNVKRDKWTISRLAGLFIAIALLPIPPSWFKSAASAANPGGKEESTLSVLLLGLGAHLCAMPVALGCMTIVWDGLGITATRFGEGLAEIVAGAAAAVGLYFARESPVFGLVLIAAATVAMSFLASWALAGVIVIGAIVSASALGRWLAPPSARVLAT